MNFNVALRLDERAVESPHRLALAVPDRRVRGGFSYQTRTFAQLRDEADALAHGLLASGLTSGTRVALMVPPSVEFFALTFALLKLGAVPVLIDPGMGVRNLGKCLRQASPEAFVGVPKAHLARRLLGWAKGAVALTVTTGRFGGRLRYENLLGHGAAKGTFPTFDAPADRTAAILFTSGSTGVAKGVVYRHDTFWHQARMIQGQYGIEPGEVDLCTFPLFALFAPAFGVTAVVPAMDPTRPARVDPENVRRHVEDFGVTQMFGSPALLKRVGYYGSERGWTMPTLRRVVSAGAPASNKVLEAFQSLLVGPAEIHTPYGATECLPVSTIGSREILDETRHLTAQGRGVCVGRPFSGMTVEVIRVNDEPIADWSRAEVLGRGEVGEFAVSGPVTTHEYYADPGKTRLAKIVDGGRVWHRMGDVGSIDDSGRLWFCGRKSHRVETAAGTMHTSPAEGVFDALPGVARSALVGVERGGGVEPVICVEPEANAARGGLREEVLGAARSHAHTSAIREVLFHPLFPVDVRHNAKIAREKLAPWAAKKLRGARP